MLLSTGSRPALSMRAITRALRARDSVLLALGGRRTAVREVPSRAFAPNWATASISPPTAIEPTAPETA